MSTTYICPVKEFQYINLSYPLQNSNALTGQINKALAKQQLNPHTSKMDDQTCQTQV